MAREQDLDGAVVVITGASSGNGRATTHAFAQEGARLVLAARQEEALRSTARECEQLGAAALAVPTDTSQPGDVDALARRALERFGQIDVWINCAAVLHFGRFDETPVEAIHRVIETNLLGYMHGARAAIRCFRRQGWGTLINVSSVLSVIAQPYAGAYVASKFAIRGLSECLRQELHDEPDIHVCTVLPAAIDTPIYRRAANYTGHAVQPIWPLYDPGIVAAALVSLARRPRREVYAGGIGPLIALQRTLAPALTERIVRHLIDWMQIRRAYAAPTDGNLFEPVHDSCAVRGGWRKSPALRPTPRDVLLGLVLVASAGAVLAVRRPRRSTDAA